MGYVVVEALQLMIGFIIDDSAYHIRNVYDTLTLHTLLSGFICNDASTFITGLVSKEEKPGEQPYPWQPAASSILVLRYFTQLHTFTSLLLQKETFVILL